MDFLKQYIKVINYSLIGMVFGFACFYILANAYHYLEIRKDFVTEFSSQPLVTDLNTKINTVLSNANSFDSSKYRGKMSTSQMMLISQNLKSCVSAFKNDTVNEMIDKDRITIVDVYNLRESYDDKVLSGCIVGSLNWTKTIDEKNTKSKYLLNNREMIKLYSNYLLKETSYLKKDLLNNSSYFYNTSIASNSVKDSTRDGFYEVMSSYNKAADFVLYISNWFKNEVEGNYD